LEAISGLSAIRISKKLYIYFYLNSSGKALAAKQKKEKEITLENYRQRLRKEISAIYVCRPQDNHRWVSVSSAVYQNRYKKKYEYY